MKRETVNYALVGLAVVGALALLGVALLRITGTTGPTESYSTVYGQVTGVGYGTPVYYEGYRVGEVASVVPERDGLRTRFRVWLAIDEDWPLPEDSVAQIATDGLLSDVFIYIREGESTTALAPGAELAGQESEDLFAALGSLATQAQQLAEGELRPLLERVNSGVAVVADSLEEGTPRLMDQANDLLASLERSAVGVEDLLSPENRETIAGILRDFGSSAESAAMLAEELRGSRSDLDAVLEEAEMLFGENRPEIDRMVRGLSVTLDQLSARLDSIAFNLDEASRNFNEFARAIRRNPNRLLFTPEADEVATEDEP